MDDQDVARFVAKLALWAVVIGWVIYVASQGPYY